MEPTPSDNRSEGEEEEAGVDADHEEQDIDFHELNPDAELGVVKEQLPSNKRLIVSAETPEKTAEAMAKLLDPHVAS